MPHTQHTNIMPEEVCACVCVCVCVCDRQRFSQVAKQEERLHEEGRVSLAPSLGQVSTIVSALDVCMNVLYGCVYVCMHACMHHPKTIHRSPPNFPATHAKKAPAKCLTSPLGRWRQTRARRRRCGSSLSPTERYPDRHSVLCDVAQEGH